MTQLKNEFNAVPKELQQKWEAESEQLLKEFLSVFKSASSNEVIVALKSGYKALNQAKSRSEHFLRQKAKKAHAETVDHYEEKIAELTKIIQDRAK